MRGGIGVGGGGGGGHTPGLGDIGTIGHGGGTGSGYGAGAGDGGAATKAPAVKPGVATTSGSLGKDVIRRVVRAQLGMIRFCYEKGLARDPSLVGTVVVTFDIATSGAVANASAKGFDGEVDACIAKRVGAIQFPTATEATHVSYPFELTPGG